MKKTLNINPGPEFIIDYGGSGVKQFPFLSAFEDKVITNFSQHTDTYIDHATDGMRISFDCGNSWPVFLENADSYFTSITRLYSGELFALSYVTYWIDDKHSTCYYSISPDNGISWTKHTGVVTFSEAQDQIKGSGWGGILFHRSLLQMSDGSLRATMYGKYAGDKKYRCLWVMSSDGGASWSVVSVIAFDSEVGIEGYCEPVVSRCADGSLLCVMRTGSNCPLYQCRTFDDGLTWTVPENLQGVDPESTFSVDPDLCLMSNGVLILSYGRPGCRLLFSPDGNGEKWDSMTEVCTSKTSGYTGLREIAPGRLLVIGDKGSDWMNPASFAIWGRYINVGNLIAMMNRPETRK